MTSWLLKKQEEEMYADKVREWKIKNRETSIRHEKETCSLLKNRRLRCKKSTEKRTKSNRELSMERIISLKNEKGVCNPNANHVKVWDLILSCTRKELDELFDLGNFNYLANFISPDEWTSLHNCIALRDEQLRDLEYEKRKSSW